MRIATYIESVYRTLGGNHTYEVELVRHLGKVDRQNEYTLFTSGTYKNSPEPDTSGNPRFTRRSLSLPHPVCQALWMLTGWPAVNAGIGEHDLYHAMSPHVFPARGGKYLVTVHDIFSVVVPHLVPPRHRRVDNMYIRRMLKRADHFVAVSEYTKRDMVERLRVSPSKITVIPEGVKTGFGVLEKTVVEEIGRKHGIEGPYFIVGGSSPQRKNLLRVIRAFARLRDGRSSPVRLVITTPGGGVWQEAADEITRCRIEDAVTVIRNVSDQELVALINGAVGLLFVSLYEGFGLPILEAMACDTPVITSSVSSMPEVAGDAAILVDPTDEEAIARGMRLLLEDEAARGRLVEAGRARLRMFTWESAARQYVQLYESLV